jgi:hypothetical protein
MTIPSRTLQNLKKLVFLKADGRERPVRVDQRQTTADGPPTGSDRPTPVLDVPEMTGAKQLLAPCSNLG